MDGALCFLVAQLIHKLALPERALHRSALLEVLLNAEGLPTSAL